MVNHADILNALTREDARKSAPEGLNLYATLLGVSVINLQQYFGFRPSRSRLVSGPFHFRHSRLFPTIGGMITTPSPASDSASATSSTGHTFLSAVDRVLYPITLGYTGVILGFQVYEFCQGGVYRPRYPGAEVYLTLLTAYAAQREGVKWLGADETLMRLRRGELFVGLWFAVYLLMWAMANLSMRWVLPSELQMVTLGVLGIFVATGVSSGLRSRSARPRAAAAGETPTVDRKETVLKLLKDMGPLSSSEVAQRLGWSQPTAWRTLEELEKDKRVTQDGTGNPSQRRYRIAP